VAAHVNAMAINQARRNGRGMTQTSYPIRYKVRAGFSRGRDYFFTYERMG
jgi:hypothetical protein